MPLYQFLQGTLRRRRHWVLARETQQNEDKNNSPIHASPAPCVIHICRRKHLTACTVVHYSLLIKPLTSFFKVERWHKCMNVVWSCLFVFLIQSGQHWFKQYLFLIRHCLGFYLRIFGTPEKKKICLRTLIFYLWSVLDDLKRHYPGSTGICATLMKTIVKRW